MSLFVSLATATAVIVSVALLAQYGPRAGRRLPFESSRWNATLHALTTIFAIGGAVAAFHTSTLGSTVADLAPDAHSGTVAAATTAVATALTVLLALWIRKRRWSGGPGQGAERHALASGSHAPRAPGAAADRRVWIALAAGTFLAALVLELDGWDVLSLGTPAVVGTAVGSYLLYALAILPVQPPATRGFTAARPPTDAERERVEACYRQLGRAPGTVVVAEGAGERWGLLAAGRLAGPHLWLKESLLDGASDDALAAAIAIHDGRARRGFFTVLLTSLIVVAVTVVLAAGRLLETADPWAAIPLLGVSLGATAVGGWLAGRISARAEAAARESVGANAVRRAYEELGTDLTIVDYGRLGSRPLPRWMNPETPTAWRVLRVPEMPVRRRAPPPDGTHWPLVGAPVFGPVGLLLSEGLLRAAHRVGLLSSARLSELLDGLVSSLIPVLVLASTVALYGVYRQRQRAAPGEWVPHVAYYAVGIPILAVLVALVYLGERAYRAHWLWRPDGEAFGA